MGQILSCNQFSKFLVDQLPVYDKLIIRDIRPEDTWIGTYESGTFEAYSSTEHTYDRFKHVYPNVAKEWRKVNAGSCIGTPCDKIEHRIGWGYERNTYFLEEQSWQTDLICFDQVMHITKAREHFQQIVSDILRPATNAIMSHFLRKRAAEHAGTKWLANATMSDFTYHWETSGDDEIYLVLDSGTAPTSKLTPQMLQRRVHPLMLAGYMGKQPFKDMPALIELVTDMETVWELDKAANDAVSQVKNQWRFQDWTEANKYYKYAFRGQLGNYVIRADSFPLRFNKITNTRFQLVLPYKNVPVTEGIGSIPNPDYEKAQYQFSIIWHRRAMVALTAKSEPVNPMMPFAQRDFGGRWQFVMDNLGADSRGCVIENKRRNKGQFIADFKLSAKPQYTEFAELIFHMREPACVVVVAPCNADPGYPEQNYNSANDPCPAVLSFTPQANGSGTYSVAANTITCNDVPIVHAAVSGANLAALVASLTANVAILGTWAVDPDDNTKITLSGSPCAEVGITWVTS